MRFKDHDEIESDFYRKDLFEDETDNSQTEDAAPEKKKFDFSRMPEPMSSEQILEKLGEDFLNEVSELLARRHVNNEIYEKEITRFGRIQSIKDCMYEIIMPLIVSASCCSEDRIIRDGSDEFERKLRRFMENMYTKR